MGQGSSFIMATTQKITTGGAVTAGGTITSFSNTPQATDDTFTENNSTLLSSYNNTTLQLDVMANDLGGAAKSLYSIDDGVSPPTTTKVAAPADLTHMDALVAGISAWEEIHDGDNDVVAKIRIDNGKVDIDLAGYLSKHFGAEYTNLQDLGVGQVVDLHFTYAIKLGNGTLSWANADIHYTGVNDAVIVKAADVIGTVTETVGTPASGVTLGDTGAITFKDADFADTHTVTNGTFNATWSNVTSALGTLTSHLDSDTTVGDGGKVTWSYSVDAAAVEYLADGEHRKEAFDVTIKDGHGGDVTKTIIVDVVGTEDAPVISVGADDSAVEGVTETDAGLTASGTLTVVDVDLSDTVTPTVASVSLDGYAGGLTNANVLGMLTVSPALIDADTGASSNLNWNFDSATQAFDFLAKDETLTLIYSVKVDDTHVGGTDTQDVTITITGTNDTPTLTVVDDTGSMDEGDGAAILTASGTLSVADVDHGDIVTVTTSYNGDIVWDGGTLSDALKAALVAGFTANGTGWDYSSGQNLDFLAKDETITFSYDVAAKDDSGALNDTSASQTITITITGTNDAPTLDAITPQTITDTTASGDTFGPITGQLLGHDVDLADNLTYGLGPLETGTSAYGSLAIDPSGSYTFTPNSAAIDALASGQNPVVTFVVQVSDGNGVATQPLVIDIHGATEPPPPPSDPNGPTGVVFDISGAQAGNNLPNLGTFVATGDDSASDTFKWSVSGDSHIVVDQNTGQLGAAGIAPGTYSFTVTATDTDAAAAPSASQTFTLLVGNTPTDDTIPTSPTLVLSGSNNIEVGLGGEDRLNGSSGVDYILGGSGDDVITGNSGADFLSGGTGGKDTFQYLLASDSLFGSGDKIYQFDSGTSGNHDTIDLTALHLAAGSVSVSINGAVTVVHANVNGGGIGAGDLEITLVGLHLTASDVDILA